MLFALFGRESQGLTGDDAVRVAAEGLLVLGVERVPPAVQAKGVGDGGEGVAGVDRIRVVGASVRLGPLGARAAVAAGAERAGVDEAPRAHFLLNVVRVAPFARSADEASLRCASREAVLDGEAEGEADVPDSAESPFASSEAEGEVLDDAPEDESDEDDPLDPLPDELDKPVESDAPEESDEPEPPSRMPVSMSAESESLFRPEVSPQRWKAPTPWSSRSFSATAICWLRLARSALGA